MNKSQFVCTFAASLTCLPRLTDRGCPATHNCCPVRHGTLGNDKSRRSALHGLGRRWTSGCKARTLARTPVGDLRCPARRRRRHRWSACYAIKSIDLDPATYGLARGEEAYSIAMLLREEQEGRNPALLFELSLSPMIVGRGSRCGVPAYRILMTRCSQGPGRPCSGVVLPHGRC